MPSSGLSIGRRRRQPSSRYWMYGDVFTATPAYTSFAGSNASVVVRSSVGPDRKFHAMQVIENSATSLHSTARVNQPLTLTAVPYIHVVFVKRIIGNRNVQVLSFDSTGSAAEAAVTVDLTTGHILVAAATTGSFSLPSARVKPAGDGWFEIHLMYTGFADTGMWFAYRLLSGTTASYLGDGLSSIAVWGTRLSLGST